MVSQNKMELRTYVRNRTLLGVSLKEIYEELKSVHGNVTVSLSTICRWMKKFKSGNFSVENAPYSGRPKSAMTKMNVDAVKSMVTEDARYTVLDIAKSLRMSSGTVHQIRTKELNLQKISARWVSHLLTDEQKEKRVKLSKNLLKKFKKCDKRKLCNLLTGDETWVYYFEPQRKVDNRMWLKKGSRRPIVAKRSQSAKKVLYSVFFDSSGPVVQIPTPHGRTINGHYYTNKVLKASAHSFKRLLHGF